MPYHYKISFSKKTSTSELKKKKIRLHTHMQAQKEISCFSYVPWKHLRRGCLLYQVPKCTWAPQKTTEYLSKYGSEHNENSRVIPVRTRAFQGFDYQVQWRDEGFSTLPLTWFGFQEWSLILLTYFNCCFSCIYYYIEQYQCLFISILLCYMKQGIYNFPIST